MNGEALGIFSLVEEVDGRFTHQHFEGGDGNLYKEQWPVTTDAEALDASLRTNEDAPDHAAMAAFSAELSAALPDELPAVLARYMDIEQLMGYLAVDRAITNWDGITAFYCGESGCYNHNYFIYQAEDEPRFTLIPWDLDNTFWLVGPLDRVPGALDIPEDCATRLPGIGELMVAAPACDPLLGGLARSDRSLYAARVTELLDGPLESARLDAWFDEQKALLEPAVAEDVYGPGLDAFRGAVEVLRADVRLATFRAAAERDGERIERFTLGATGMNDFESSNPLGLELGVAANAAPESSFHVTLGTDGALAGQHDLRLAFEFRDGLAPWSQWARLSLPFDAPRVDLTTLSVLRLTLRSDRRRTLRISFDSSRYSQPQSGATFGWDVVVDATARTLELALSTAAYPVWGPSVPETRNDVLGESTALLFDPIAEGRSDEGFLGAGATDPGQIQIDDIVFE